MSDNKTQKSAKSVTEFIGSIDNDIRKKDAKNILKLMEEITGEKPVMWGANIIGFGEYHYRYASGREGDWMRIGFSPRKNYTSVYIMDGFSNYEGLMQKLGKYKVGKSCLNINKIEDVDIKILKALIHQSFHHGKMGVE